MFIYSLVTVAVIMLGFAITTAFIVKIPVFDAKIFHFIATFITPSHTRQMVSISFLGNYLFLIPGNVILIACCIVLKNNRLAIRAAITALTSLGLMSALKHLFHRVRPEAPLVEGITNYSFPSGHALMSISFYGFLIYIAYYQVRNSLFRNIVISFLLLLILLISFSRIYLRVHYTSDVVAGLSIGLIWLVMIQFIMDKTENRFSQNSLKN